MGMHHEHCGKDTDSSSRNIGVALALNASFALIELVGGYLTGSVAIIADALHDFGDSLSLGMAYVLERLSKKKNSRNFSYGYRRLSLLGALITSLILISGSVTILIHAVPRLFNPVQPVAEGMLGLAVLGLVVNGYAAWRVRQGESMNEQTISWHLLEDFFGWIVVLIGSVIMMFWDVPIIDPILSIVFTSVILIGVMRPFFATVKLFLQGIPADLHLESLKKDVLQVRYVKDVHDIHVWSLDGVSHVMTLHAVVESGIDMPTVAVVKDQIRKQISSHGAYHVTLEVETALEDCPDVNCVST